MQPTISALPSFGPDGTEVSPKRLQTARGSVLKRQRLAEREQTQRRVVDIGCSATASSHRLPAQVRLEQLGERVRARIRASEVCFSSLDGL